MEEHFLLDLLKQQKAGVARGVMSACTSNPYVIEMCLQNAKQQGTIALVEATANQVNQYGGYSNMKPADFAKFVYDIADKVEISKDSIILGGDHLGPLVWQNETENDAMDKAEELILLYAKAGFSKIHIDTSMRLQSDAKDEPLSVEKIALRSARLAQVAEKAFRERAGFQSTRLPVYVIGSEVPVPGGAQEQEKLAITSKENASETLDCFEKEYKRVGLEDAWQRVVALVVQPGVEFSDDGVHAYNRKAAHDLTECMKQKKIILEGHSTDYQTAKCLREMVEDGIAILKVGPALTYSLREGLFALSDIEAELSGFIHEPSYFKERLDYAMTQNPAYWRNYYRGSESEMHLKRKYSFSDRSRYYLACNDVKISISKLLDNLEHCEMPLTLLSQYMPSQYKAIRNGELSPQPKMLLLDCVNNCIKDYNQAVF